MAGPLQIDGPRAAYSLASRIASSETVEGWRAEVIGDTWERVSLRLERPTPEAAPGEFAERCAIAEDAFAFTRRLGRRPHLANWDDLFLLETGPDGPRPTRGHHAADTIVQVLQWVPGRCLADVASAWSAAERRYAVGPVLIDLGKTVDDLDTIDGIGVTAPPRVVRAAPELRDVRLTDRDALPRTVVCCQSWVRPVAADEAYGPPRHDARRRALAPLARMAVELLGGTIASGHVVATERDVRDLLADSPVLDAATAAVVVPHVFAALQRDGARRPATSATRWTAELVRALRPRLTLQPPPYVRPSSLEAMEATEAKPHRPRRRVLHQPRRRRFGFR